MKKIRFGLRQKIILLYILLGIIPILLMVTLSYFNYLKDIQRNTAISLNFMQKQCVEEIEQNLNGYKSAMAKMITDKGVNKDVRTLGQDVENREATRTSLYNRFLSYASSCQGAIGITYISNDLEYVSCSFIDSRIDATSWQFADFREKFLTASNKNFSIDHYTLQHSKDIAPNNLTGDMLYLSFPFYEVNTSHKNGVLIMEIPSKVFLEGMVIDLWGGVKNIIADADGVVLLSLQPELVGLNIHDLSYTDGFQYISCSQPVQNSRFIFYSFVKQEAITDQVQKFRSLMTVFAAVLCLVFFTIMYAVMRRYTKSIVDVARGIQLYGEGNREVNLPVNTNDEISIIAKRFNRMARENNGLLQDLQDQNQSIARISSLRRKAEIKALQAQINPHFLYNTLDTINWIAIDNSQTEISNMIKALSSLLRYSISNIDQLVLLEAELAWCQKYIYLQQKRFDTYFDFRIDASIEAKEAPIHKMLLQPLLENCIVHGFEDIQQQKNKQILLKCSVRDDHRLAIDLQDNGRGMEAGTLARIQAMIDNPEAPDTNEIGISNVVSRIRLYYGKQGEIHIDSGAGGTKIHIVIPATDIEASGGYPT